MKNNDAAGEGAYDTCDVSISLDKEQSGSITAYTLSSVSTVLIYKILK